MSLPILLPTGLPELWAALEEHPGAALLAGGTDLLVKLRAGSAAPPLLISLDRLPACREVFREGDTLVLGALCTHTELLENPLVARELPVLHRALARLGSPLIRNQGTLGGNLATASPAGDTLPPLYVLDAQVELLSARGSRLLPIADFIEGPGRTALQSGEIIASVRAPLAGPANRFAYTKVGRRQALAIGLVSQAALLHLDGGGVVRRASLAWGSVGPTVIRSREVEQALEDRALDGASLRQAADLALLAVRPQDDVRATARGRGIMVERLVLGLRELLEE